MYQGGNEGLSDPTGLIASTDALYRALVDAEGGRGRDMGPRRLGAGRWTGRRADLMGSHPKDLRTRASKGEGSGPTRLDIPRPQAVKRHGLLERARRHPRGRARHA